jgi:hypothetical protein
MAPGTGLLASRRLAKLAVVCQQFVDVLVNWFSLAPFGFAPFGFAPFGFAQGAGIALAERSRSLRSWPAAEDGGAYAHHR